MFRAKSAALEVISGFKIWLPHFLENETLDKSLHLLEADNTPNI